MTTDPAANQTAGSAAGSSPRWRAEARDLLIAWLHLSVLWAFAVARPLFDVLADSPEFFVARGNTSADIVLLALAVTLVPPSALVAIEALATPVPQLRRVLHTIFVAGLAGTLALRLLVDLTTGSSGLLIPIAVVSGVAFAALYVSTRLVPTTLTVLAPMPALFIVLFLVFSPVSDLVFPEEIEVAPASGKSGSSAGPPVVWVTFDEFSSASLMTSDGRLNAERYPNFARLARESTWYRDATTVDGSTTRAVPALMSGTYPEEDELPTAADHPGSIFTLLGGNYSMNVTEAATAVCPTDLCGESSLTEDTSERARALVTDLGIVTGHLLLPTDLRRRLPAVDRSFGDFADQGRDSPAAGGPPAAAKEIPAGSLARRDQLFERFVRSIKPRPRRPPLHFLHTALPHVPWQYLPSGQQYAVSGPDIPGLTDEQWANDPVLVDQAAQRYLLQLGFADRLIGRLVGRLRETGLYDRSVIVVTADHGVSFQPGGPRRGANPDTMGEIVGVPLFIKAPRQREGRVDTSNVRTIDIVPTVADLLDLELPYEADGRSLADGPARSDGSFLYGIPPTPVDFQGFLRNRREATVRLTTLFGTEGAERLFAYGPNSELVGARVSEIRDGGRTAATAAPARRDVRFELDTPALYSDVDPGATLLPTFVTGRLSGPIEPDVAVAVAINGRIAATTRAYPNDDEVRVGAMVSPSALRAGANEVELFTLDSRQGRTELALVPGAAQGTGATLVEDAGDTYIALGSGRRVKVVDDEVSGYLDAATSVGDSLTLDGWAADAEDRKAADQVLAFADGKLLTQGRPSIARPDLVGEFGENAKRSGFHLVAVSGDAEELASPDRLRVFGVSGDRASELGVSRNASFGR